MLTSVQGFEADKDVEEHEWEDAQLVLAIARAQRNVSP